MKTKRLVLISLFAALMAVVSPFSIKIGPIPLSFATLMVMITSFVLGNKDGVIVVFVYILLALFGIPVLSGFNSGAAALFGMTGGYIFGFLFTAVFLAATRGEKYSFKRYALLGCIVGIPLIYLPVFLQLKLGTGMPWDKAFMTGVLPFIPLDIVKCLAAAFLAGPIHRIFDHK